MALADDIAALTAAIRQGIQTVEYDGRRVTYRSLDEMRSILSDMERDQSAAQGGSRVSRQVFGTSRGWR